MVQPFSKIVWKFFTKLNVFLPNDPMIPLFDIYPNELKTYVHTKFCAQMLITKIAKTINQDGINQDRINQDVLQQMNG